MTSGNGYNRHTDYPLKLQSALSIFKNRCNMQDIANLEKRLNNYNIFFINEIHA